LQPSCLRAKILAVASEARPAKLGLYAPRASTACASVLISVLLLGCTKHHSERATRSDAGLVRGLPRYFLRNTPVLDKPGGHEKYRVSEPVLVSLLPDGRVRALPGSEPSFEGYLPKALLLEPHEQQGLFLYAQRVAELRLGRPDGPVIGLLHPGAFVSVAPSQARYTRVGSLGFGGVLESLPAYVARDALGVTATDVALSPPIGKHRATLGYPYTVSFEDSAYKYEFLPCIDVWIEEQTARLSQYVAAVQLMGFSEYVRSGESDPRVKSYFSVSCPAHIVSRAAAGLELTFPIGPYGAKRVTSVDRIPEGYATIRIPRHDALAATIERSRSIYWLEQTEEGPSCSEWRFKFQKKISEPTAGGARLKALLIRRTPVTEAGFRFRAWHGAEYRPSNGQDPARLHLDSLMYDNQPAARCLCYYDYAVLADEGAELHMMARPMPPRSLAYDPSEVERWFLSGERCEAARKDAMERLARDGRLATRIGFHAQR
jgi:hypothetical protein